MRKLTALLMVALLAFMPVMADEKPVVERAQEGEVLKSILEDFDVPELKKIESDSRAAAKEARRIAAYAERDARKLDEIADEARDRRRSLEDEAFDKMLEAAEGLTTWEKGKKRAVRLAFQAKRWWQGS